MTSPLTARTQSGSSTETQPSENVVCLPFPAFTGATVAGADSEAAVVAVVVVVFDSVIDDKNVDIGFAYFFASFVTVMNASRFALSV